MNLKRLTGTAIINNQNLACYGSMEINNKTEKTAYITWKMFDEMGKLISARSKTFFIGKGVNDEIHIPLVLNDILAYRIARKHVFSNLVSDTD